MPKKRKTRKEKILTDQKKPIVQGIESTTTSHNAMNIPSSPAKMQKADIQDGPTFSLPSSYIAKHEQPKTTISSRAVVISTNEYTYLAKDLKKTALLTGAIFIIEILLRFFYLH